jgi:hypothetical protein
LLPRQENRIVSCPVKQVKCTVGNDCAGKFTAR